MRRHKRQFYLSAVKAYNLFDLTTAIGQTAFTIIKKYHLQYSISVADALIAATAIENRLPLYTDNVADYSFIIGLQLFSSK